MGAKTLAGNTFQPITIGRVGAVSLGDDQSKAWSVCRVRASEHDETRVPERRSVRKYLPVLSGKGEATATRETKRPTLLRFGCNHGACAWWLDSGGIRLERESLPTFGAPGAENFASVPSCAACAESMGSGALETARLEGAFHGVTSTGKRQEGGRLSGRKKRLGKINDPGVGVNVGRICRDRPVVDNFRFER